MIKIFKNEEEKLLFSLSIIAIFSAYLILNLPCRNNDKINNITPITMQFDILIQLML